MVGNTYPEKASPASIRGSLYADPTRYGLASVDISTNGVHLSAGPFEGVFELINFFGSLYARESSPIRPLLVKKLIAQGQSAEDALQVVNNPQVSVDGKATDLFSATEDFDTDPAIELWLKNQ